MWKTCSVLIALLTVGCGEAADTANRTSDSPVDGGPDVGGSQAGGGGEGASEGGQGGGTGGLEEGGAGGSAGAAGEGGSGGYGGGIGGSGGELGGSGGEGGAPECVPPDTQCDGLDLQTCDQNRTWQTTQTCPFVCNQGACTGVCVPNSQQCDGLTPQTCNVQGQWDSGQPCQYVCTGGVCTGACTPNDLECNGTTLEQCDQNGAWQPLQVCPYVCLADACTGVCVPNATQCNGNTVETCNALGQWTSGAPCPFVCQGGACTGVCVPGTKQCDGTGWQECDQNGQWGSTTPCPGDVNADPTCTGNGICGTVCQGGYDDCTPDPGCESDLDDPATCGSCSNACDGTNGTPTCSGGNCGIICDGGWDDCTGDPGCETPLGTLTDCLSCNDACGAPPAHASAACLPGGCGYECDLPSWDDCDGNPANGCELDVTSDEWNCGACDAGCYGGTCSASTCSEPIELVTWLSADVTSMTLGATEVFWTTATGEVKKVDKAGGSVTTLATGQNGPTSILINGTDAIWSNTTSPYGIESVNIGGGSVVELVGSWGPLELTVGDGFLWWSDQTSYDPPPSVGTTHIRRMPVTGGIVDFLPVLPMNSYPRVFGDSTYMYRLALDPGGSIGGYRYFLDGTYMNQMLSCPNGCFYGKFFQEAPTGNFFVWHLTATQGVVAKMDRSGGASTVLVSLSPSAVPTALAVDANEKPYLAFGNNVRQIRSYSPTTSHAYNQQDPKLLLADDTHLYWVVDGFWYQPYSSTPAIVRVAK